MKACGLVVEYNPFHYGHLHHLEQSKHETNADCMIAVMSGPFLQRGEPAITDKWSRARAALESGIDLVIELPALFAVEHSDLFSKGAIMTLKELGIDALCFGSEHGNIESFTKAADVYQNHQESFDASLHEGLAAGRSFPEAARSAYQSIGLTEGEVDLSKPNNILGFSYVKQLRNYAPDVKATTIQRINNDYHDENITGNIASATSIRKELLREANMTEEAAGTLPESTQHMLLDYKHKTGMWHHWEFYFPFLHYRILTMSKQELRTIHTVEEGLENRLKRVAKQANSFQELMEGMKTKRYTWTRLQRMFTHLLCNNKAEEAQSLLSMEKVPYVRILGMNATGQEYLKKARKHAEVPFINQIQQLDEQLLAVDERAANAYYSVLLSPLKSEMIKQELQPPLRIHAKR
ncbi:nucleotidyltransferase [Thalassobacillus devorans]|uniref:nucleotidyltransferase n=1 Tax=Thalassobacillus devorans TaxID=279813 RepID=UPI00048ECBFC|nr:nucleotidyltransferase [Thalassobacillus devorans]